MIWKLKEDVEPVIGKNIEMNKRRHNEGGESLDPVQIQLAFADRSLALPK